MCWSHYRKKMDNIIVLFIVIAKSSVVPQESRGLGRHILKYERVNSSWNLTAFKHFTKRMGKLKSKQNILINKISHFK